MLCRGQVEPFLSNKMNSLISCKIQRFHSNHMFLLLLLTKVVESVLMKIPREHKMTILIVSHSVLVKCTLKEASLLEPLVVIFKIQVQSFSVKESLYFLSAGTSIAYFKMEKYNLLSKPINILQKSHKFFVKSGAHFTTNSISMQSEISFIQLFKG